MLPDDPKKSVDSLLQQSARFIEHTSSISLLMLLVLLSILFPVLLFPSHGIGHVKPLDRHFSYPNRPTAVRHKLLMTGSGLIMA